MDSSEVIEWLGANQESLVLAGTTVIFVSILVAAKKCFGKQASREREVGSPVLKARAPRKPESVRITRMFIHPIKSCRRLEVTEAEVDHLGFKHDRRFIIWDSKEKKMVTMRDKRRLTQIVPKLSKTHMTVSCPQMEDLNVPLSVTPEELGGEGTDILIWRVTGKAHQPVEEWSRWISRAIYILHGGEEPSPSAPPRYNLLRCRTPREMKTDHLWGEIFGDTRASFVDGSPFMALGQRSVEHVNQMMKKTAEEAGKPVESVTVDMFRGNLVLEGDIDAWEEDSWKVIRIGKDLVLRKSRPCSRCVVTTINPITGEGSKQYEPLKTLRKFRSGDDERVKNSPLVGCYFSHVDQSWRGTVKVGDEITVEEFTDRRQFLEGVITA